MAGTLVLEVYSGEEEGWKILNTETYDDLDYEKVLKIMKMKKIMWDKNYYFGHQMRIINHAFVGGVLTPATVG